MFFYVLMMAVVTGFAVLEMAYPDSERLKRWMINISAFGIIILAGLRMEVGGDWGAYLSYHVLAAHEPFSNFIGTNDLGYTGIEWPLAQLGLGVWSINLVCAALLAVGIVLLASTVRYRNLFFLSATPYLLIVVGMGYSRQSAAIGMVCIALYCSFRNRWVAAALFAVGSLFYHKSAAFGILPILLSFGKKRWHSIVIAMLAIPAIGYVVVIAAFENVQTEYIQGDYKSAGAAVRVAQIFLCGVWYLLILRKRENPERKRLLTLLACFSILMPPALVLSPSSTLVDRLALYLLPLQCYTLARTPESFLRGSSRTLAYSIVLFINFAIFGVWITTSDNLNSWIPYKNYLWSEPLAPVQ